MHEHTCCCRLDLTAQMCLHQVSQGGAAIQSHIQPELIDGQAVYLPERWSPGMRKDDNRVNHSRVIHLQGCHVVFKGVTDLRGHRKALQTSSQQPHKQTITKTHQQSVWFQQLLEHSLDILECCRYPHQIG